MRNQKIRAQRYRANKFIMKRLNGTRAHHAIRRRQIDQVIVVDDQRPQAKLGAARPEPRGVRLRDACAPARPHPRARGKNLQRVRTQFRRGIERPGDIPRDRSVNSDAEAAILPRGRLRCRFRLRAIFVADVVGGFCSVQWVSHSLSNAFK